MKRRISALWVVAMCTVVVVGASTTIPIDMGSGRPVVEIEVEGGATLRMVLDTGASNTVIDASLADELGLEVVGEQLIGDPSGRKQHRAETMVLPGVRIGSTSFGDLEVAALNFPAAMGHGRRPFDGVLSVRNLSRQLVTLDLAAGELRLSEGQLDLEEEGVVRFYTDDMAIPWVQMLVGPLTVHAFLDTGNPGQISLSKSISQYLELDGPLEVVGEGRTVSSTFEISAASLDGAVELAGHTIENPTLNFDKLHSGTQANIGSGLLRQFVVTLDQKNQLVRFGRASVNSNIKVASVNPSH